MWRECMASVGAILPGSIFGYFISTDGRDEVVVRDDIRRREEQDRRLDQLNFDLDEPPSGGTR